MTDKPNLPKTPSSAQRQEADDLTRQPAPGAASPSAEADEGPLESLGKAIVEPVLGAERTTTAERVRDKLDGRDEKDGRSGSPDRR